VSTLNDCLSIFPVQGLARRPLKDGWRMRHATLGEGEDQGFTQPQFDDSGWEPVAVPKLHRGVAGREALWYRVHFPRPTEGPRTLLRFDGAFLVANVWLNGKLLGSHYGYFAPFSFDVTSSLQDQNVLAVCVEAPVELELQKKKHVMGVFNDWDCKPYANNNFFTLPPEYEWHVPLGLWQPVFLEAVGPVAVEWIHCTPRLEAGDTGRVLIRARLRNLDVRNLQGEIQLRLRPANFESDHGPLQVRRAFTVRGHDVLEVEFELSVPNPQLWWPWTHGKPNLYAVDFGVLTDQRESCYIRERFGLRQVSLERGPDGWVWRLNGRVIWAKGANYISNFFLDASTPELLAQDLRLAREANMDCLRVHAHVEPEVFYRQADEAGILLLQDFPLIFVYAYQASHEDEEFFQDAVRSQIPEMVHLLYNHPGIILWMVHNEPAWPNRLAYYSDAHRALANRDIDLEGARMIGELDRERPCVPASGDEDEHLYYGWYSGNWRDFATDHPGFPTEYGAQSLPNADSPVWQSLRRDWPIPVDEPSWRYACYQPLQWGQHGVGPPENFLSREAYITASQDYQATLCRFATQRFRLQKFERCGGALVFQFVDCFPGITWSLLDHARLPKAAYFAMRDAFAPTVVIADFADGTIVVDHHALMVERGQQIRFRLVVVNDDFGRQGPAIVHWELNRVRQTTGPWWLRLRALWERPRERGTLRIEELPAADAPALAVAEIVRRFGVDGDYELVTALSMQGKEVTRTTEVFRVGRAQAAPGRVVNVPRLLLNRMFQSKSFAPTPEGFEFVLHNRIQSCTLEDIPFVEIDGEKVAAAQIRVRQDGAVSAEPLSEVFARGPIEVRLRSRMHFDVQVGHAVAPGAHEVLLSCQIRGFGTYTFRLRPRL
jgi:beta-mannosidase